jgi:FAD/FMN-containing dehydrogenase
VSAPADDVVLPPGLSAGDFEKVLRAFATALGEDAVRPAGQSAEFRDPYSFPGWDEHWPSAVVQPASVADVQAVLKVARQYRVPLWTTSMGKNNAYGGPAPRVKGSVLVRGHIEFTDDIAAQYDWGEHAMLRLYGTLKDALDPYGILSPGKQGIWPGSARGATGEWTRVPP